MKVVAFCGIELHPDFKKKLETVVNGLVVCNKTVCTEKEILKQEDLLL